MFFIDNKDISSFLLDKQYLLILIFKYYFVSETHRYYLPINIALKYI